METFSVLLDICAGNSPVPGEFPTQRPVTQSFDVFFDLHLNKQLGEQSWGWWFETLSLPLWRHRNGARLSAGTVLIINSLRPGMSWNWVIIGSGNGLSSGRRQAIIWTNAGILLIGPVGTNREILFEIHTFSFKKMHFTKVIAIFSQPQCIKGAVSYRFSLVLLTLMCNNSKLKADINFFFFLLRRQTSKVYNWLQKFTIQHPVALF